MSAPTCSAVRRSDTWRLGSRAEHEAAESSSSSPTSSRAAPARPSTSPTCAGCGSCTPRWRRPCTSTASTRWSPPSTTPPCAAWPPWRRTSGTGRAAARLPRRSRRRPRLPTARGSSEAARTPYLLAAHHYTRYLGDLSGGQILARAVRSGFPERALDRGGLDFYRFEQIAAPVPWKRAYRERLDALPLDGGQDAAVLEEVRAAFRLNHRCWLRSRRSLRRAPAIRTSGPAGPAGLAAGGGRPPRCRRPPRR